MWSLPDLDRLNERAVALAEVVSQLDEHPCSSGIDPETGKPFECDSCGESVVDEEGNLKSNEDGCSESQIIEYYDPFSDDPKGYAAYCPDCVAYLDESYFYCQSCERYVINNYTWEMYLVTTDEGDAICSRCAAKEFFGGDEGWFRPSDEGFDSVSAHDIRSIRHASCSGLKIGELGLPYEFTLFDTVCVDSMSGGPVYGSRSGAFEQTVSAVKEVLSRVREEHPDAEVAILMGAAYQFAVDIDIYVRYPEGAGEAVPA